MRTVRLAVVAAAVLGSLTQARGLPPLVDNTGVALVPNPVQALDALAPPPADLLKRKLDAFTDLQPGVQYNMARTAAGDFTIGLRCPTQPCDSPPPVSASVTQPLTWQTKPYTCGPASTRLVLWGLTRHDPGEASLERDEHTDPHEGTYIESIAKVLNERQRRDAFAVISPGDATTYMSYLTTDVWEMGHSLINNVETSFLSFWNGHRAYHYNVAYGYNHSRAGLVRIAEEWDPTRFGYGLASYGGENPFGFHTETLANTWAAIDGAFGEIVW